MLDRTPELLMALDRKYIKFINTNTLAKVRNVITLIAAVVSVGRAALGADLGCSASGCCSCT